MGTRLKQAVSDRQKCVADVQGRPFLFHVLEFCKRFGFRRFILCVGHKAESVEKAICGLPRLEIAMSCEETPLGTGGAIKNAMHLVNTDSFLVLNGDSFCNIDLANLMEQHLSSKALATIAVTKVENCQDYGKVSLDDSGQISGFYEKGAGGSGLVNAGIYVFHRKIQLFFPVGLQIFSLERDLFPKLIGNRIYGYVTDATLLDIGTPDRYLKAQKDLEKL